jgi:ribonuclease-3
MRAELVRQSSLAAWAREFELGDHLYLGRGEDRAGGRRRDGVLAGCFEAVVGAIYLDRGESAARRFLVPLISEATQHLALSARSSDPKSELQHRMQVATGALPAYRVVSIEGPDHRPRFTVEVEAPPGVLSVGVGGSKQAAEQEAARQSLASWEATASNPPAQVDELSRDVS